MGKQCRFAFVTTSSVCQGEQVELFWPFLYDYSLNLDFAYRPFKWVNNAKKNAGVSCVILGLSPVGRVSECIIFDDSQRIRVKNINPYLMAGDNLYVGRRTKPLSAMPSITSGNKATDGGFLFLSTEEKKDLITKYPESCEFIRQVFGAEEFINGKERWCLWIEDFALDRAKLIPVIADRIESVRQNRLSSRDKGAQKLAEKPHQFREMKTAIEYSLIIPTVSSEKRKYIPIGYLSAEDVVIAPNIVVYDPPHYLFGVLSSHMHMLWTKTVAGQLESRIRYSSALCYNNFPMPKLSQEQINEIASASIDILEVRASYPDKEIAELYDNKLMPQDLRDAHQSLDILIEKTFRNKPFTSDEERLEFMFLQYSKMLGGK